MGHSPSKASRERETLRLDTIRFFRASYLDQTHARSLDGLIKQICADHIEENAKFPVEFEAKTKEIPMTPLMHTQIELSSNRKIEILSNCGRLSEFNSSQKRGIFNECIEDCKQMLEERNMSFIP